MHDAPAYPSYLISVDAHCLAQGLDHVRGAGDLKERLEMATAMNDAVDEVVCALLVLPVRPVLPLLPQVALSLGALPSAWPRGFSHVPHTCFSQEEEMGNAGISREPQGQDGLLSFGQLEEVLDYLEGIIYEEPKVLGLTMLTGSERCWRVGLWLTRPRRTCHLVCTLVLSLYCSTTNVC